MRFNLYAHTHTNCVVFDCLLTPGRRRLAALFFRSLKPHLWADAITPPPNSTCQVPLPALTVAAEGGRLLGMWGEALDELLDPVPAFVCQACITVHFAASSFLHCAQPSLSAGVSLQKSFATTRNSISVLQLTNGKQPLPQHN